MWCLLQMINSHDSSIIVACTPYTMHTIYNLPFTNYFLMKFRGLPHQAPTSRKSLDFNLSHISLSRKYFWLERVDEVGEEVTNV